MMRFAWLLVAAGCFALAQAANVAVVNPKKPDMLSAGEVGVMLDVMAREIDGSGDFMSLSLDKMQPILDQKNAQRVDLCPDNSCLQEIGKALLADYVATLSVQQTGQPFYVKLEMYDTETGKKIAEMGGEFNGPKSQIVLKGIPSQTREMVRQAQSYAAKKMKDAAPLAVKQPAAQQLEQPKLVEKPAEAKAQPAPPSASVTTSASAALTSAQPAPAAAAAHKRKSFIRSPGFWIPVVIVLAAPVGIVYYLRQNSSKSQGSDEMGFPTTPSRPPQGSVAQQ